jgi:peptidoglycan/LPS O-acetylase OafA/YrhL
MQARARFFSNLDSLRALAALSVVLYHMAGCPIGYDAVPWLDKFRALASLNGQGGQIGVHFFFVLSGFLITYLMFLEREDTGSLNVRAFYVRRILRIWPLYFAMVLIGAIVWWWQSSPEVVSATAGRWWNYVFFLTNFDIIRHNAALNAFVDIEWSVAIEEQFYLFWPLVFAGTPRRWFPALCAAMLIGSLGYYYQWSHVHMRVYFSTFTALSSFATGALLAWVAFAKQEQLKAVVSAIPRLVFPLLYAVGMYILMSKGKFAELYHVPKWMYHAFGDVFFATIIAEQCFHARPLLPAGRLSLLDRLGKMSYGLYLLHIVALEVVMYASGVFTLHWSVWFAGGLGLSLLLSWGSFHYFEKPFNDLRKRWSRVKS